MTLSRKYTEHNSKKKTYVRNSAAFSNNKIDNY